MSGFDERCPHCEKKMERIRHDWESNDWRTEFRTGCEHCEREVLITVHQVPEFETEKLRCECCGKVEIKAGHYCAECNTKLARLSDYNAGRGGNA